jgi:arylsulfatase A-like enzyme
MIKANRETHFPAYVNDYLPTFLDVIGMAHPHPTWAADGISLMPLIRQAAAMHPSQARAFTRSLPAPPAQKRCAATFCV